MKPTKTWVLVANGSEARILVNVGPNDGLHEIGGMAFEIERPPARDIMADKQGRAFDRVGGGRHAMEYSSDPARQAEHKFAQQLSGALSDGLFAKKFDCLVIAAAPAMLAEIRKALRPDVEALVHAEIDKDYTKTALGDLTELLRRSDAI